MEQATIERGEATISNTAAGNRDVLRRAGVFAVSLCGSPGAGKTSLIEATLQRLTPEFRAGVIVGNLAAARDARRLRRFARFVADVDAAELDASRVRDVLGRASLDQIDLLLVESVGGLSGPVTTDLGQDVRVGIFSVSGGDDKAAEFPYRVVNSDLLLLSKVDLLPHVPFNLEIFRGDVRRLNAAAPLLEVSVARGTGIDEWVNWLRGSIHRCRPDSTCCRQAPEWFFG